MKITPLGAADAVYSEIKRRIVDWEYPPGEKLSESRLVSDLAVNRSPIRTALARLQSEGWLIVTPQSGTYVRNLTSEEINSVLEFRLILETHVAGVAALRMSDSDLGRLRAAFEKFGRRATEVNIDSYVDLDNMLHLAIYQAAGNELIKNTLLNLIDKIRWIRRRISEWPERNQESLGEAREILEALSARDPERASEAMRVHITNIMSFQKRLERDSDTTSQATGRNAEGALRSADGGGGATTATRRRG